MLERAARHERQAALLQLQVVHAAAAGCLTREGQAMMQKIAQQLSDMNTQPDLKANRRKAAAAFRSAARKR